MGFPADGLESRARNSREEVVRFLKQRHGVLVKVYNLCIENDRGYPQSNIPDFGLARFGFTDHNICSIRTIFDICLDIYLFIQGM